MRDDEVKDAFGAGFWLGIVMSMICLVLWKAAFYLIHHVQLGWTT